MRASPTLYTGSRRSRRPTAALVQCSVTAFLHLHDLSIDDRGPAGSKVFDQPPLLLRRPKERLANVGDQILAARGCLGRDLSRLLLNPIVEAMSPPLTLLVDQDRSRALAWRVGRGDGWRRREEI